MIKLFKVLVLVLFFYSDHLFAQIKYEEEFKELFYRVQMEEIFKDSKTFPDCTPLFPAKEIYSRYQSLKNNQGFDLRSFIHANFRIPSGEVSEVQITTNNSVQAHIEELWPILTRKPAKGSGSIIPLPYQYVVPGGRFREIYYWDSYFTMLGLKVAGKKELIRSMVKNFAYLIDTIGFIPNGNRSYYLSRSQPPFFSLMVEMLGSIEGGQVLKEFLPQLEKEYQFWMDGRAELNRSSDNRRRVVLMEGGEILNRYWDDNPRPRTESFREDSLLAKEVNRDPEDLYRNIRAACESGWDFSSRWFEDGKTLGTIITTDLIPVDLNCLLFNLEKTIAKGYGLQGQKEKSKAFVELSEKRKRAILKYCWDKNNRFFFDYNFKTKKIRPQFTLASSFPLFFQIASVDQAKAVEKVLNEKFVKPGGLVTTLAETKQQWDSPNGWPPLQLISIKGLERYKLKTSATAIKEKWVKNNIRVYKNTGKLMEKYNVLDDQLIAGGGEYPLQDGFGWTNGVLLYLLSEMD